jgi:hypothetical protein
MQLRCNACAACASTADLAPGYDRCSTAWTKCCARISSQQSWRGIGARLPGRPTLQQLAVQPHQTAAQAASKQPAQSQVSLLPSLLELGLPAGKWWDLEPPCRWLSHNCCSLFPTEGPTAEQQQTLDVMKRILEIKRMVTEGAAGGTAGRSMGQQQQQQQQQQPPGSGAGRCVTVSVHLDSIHCPQVDMGASGTTQCGA